MVIFYWIVSDSKIIKRVFAFRHIPRGVSFFFFSLPIQFILLTFAPVKQLAMTYPANSAQQRNFDFFVFFSALYLVVSEILLTHTHTGAPSV